jgi:hypothetical protein
MLSVDQSRRIWLAQHRVDFRKAHSGLVAEAYKMGLDPYSGDVIIFIGRNRRRLKILYADATGVWISSKLFTLGAMKTNFQFLIDPNCKSISQSELSLVCEGSAYTIENKVVAYTKPIDSKAVELAS